MGKSTVGTIVRAIKYVIDEPNIRILIASDSEAASVRFLREIRAHLQHNRDLIEMFGPFFESSRFDDRGRYRQGFATIGQRTDTTISEPTFQCLGIGGQAASYHFDTIFLDDIVTIRNSRTPLQRQNVSDWHGSTLIGCGLPHTRYHYLGTRYFPHDMYQDLEDGRIDEHTGILGQATLKIPAIIIDPTSGEERSNYPERYPLETLYELRRRMGRYHFAAQMQQDTRSGEGIIFNYADFRWYNRNENYPDIQSLKKFQFFDLAAKKTDTGAFFAGVTVGVTPDNRRIYVLDLVRERAGMLRQRELIISTVKKWQPFQAGVEAVQMQAGFAEEIQEVTILPVIPVTVETDKVWRARRVSPQVEAHKVYFPMDPLPSAKVTEPLIEELTTFPDAEYVDCVDAFVGAITLAMLGGPKAASPVPEDEPDEEDEQYLLADY
jgi:predicted phage terminase large subunit-like protein